ncbi:hypothetical protein [uncultured Pelagimonas sp.]|uniref:hypothetical protein n=1 Tax=uncultured Pelagimonas sp. TaxID=1618102 RepID=UPI00260D02BC|nr:hypothetical protein [uncultured Pelagimonas sp.]
MNSTVWISYDLGVRGDYEGLYAWLDDHEAKECGDSMALLKYSHSDDLIERLKSDLQAAVEINKKTRIYVIYRDRSTNKNRGKFIFGKRKAAAWVGFGASDGGNVDEED